MKVAIFINTAAQVHLFRNVIGNLESDGIDTIVLAREYGDTLDLLKRHELPYFLYSNGERSKVQKMGRFPLDVLRAFLYLRKQKPDILVGVGIYSTMTSKLLGIPSIVFNDSEPIPLQLPFLKSFSDAIITPSCFKVDLGPRHIRVPTYKELAYLHPAHFVPDKTKITRLGVREGEEFVFLRFNGFAAVHDMGVRGFTLEEKRRLVDELGKYAHVFISSEKELSEDLKKYEVAIPKEDIHHVLHFAKIIVADTQTMITEGAVLGTPGIRYNTFVGDRDMGNFVELHDRYDLVFNFAQADTAIEKAVELVQIPGLKQQWTCKRQALLNEKIDLAQYLTRFIEEYPTGLNAPGIPEARSAI